MKSAPYQSSSGSYMRLANEQERNGKFYRALQILRLALQNPTYKAMKNIIKGSIERILCKCATSARYAVWPLETLYENGNSPRTVGVDSVNIGTAPIVSLTTISSRVDRVSHTIDRIARQSLSPHSINLYISEDPYLLDQGVRRGDESLRRIADMGANIYLTSNIGPYRKQYPLLQQLRSANASPETLIVTMDDDVLYPSDILAQLVNKAHLEDAVVAHRGREVAFDGRRLKPYNEFKAVTSKKSLYNIGLGKNGVAYRLKHFPTNPAEYIGPWLAPTADDIWCKWVTVLRCVPTIILEPRAMYDPRFDFIESDPKDCKCLYQAYNATGNNDNAIMNIEEFFLYLLSQNFSSIYKSKIC